MQWLQEHWAVLMLFGFAWVGGKALDTQEKAIHALRMRIYDLEQRTQHLDPDYNNFD